MDRAWDEATKGGCRRALWVTLAERRETTHTLDALTVYRRHIAHVLTQADGRAYAEAIQFLRKCSKLYAGLGRAQEFARYLAELRVAHQRKRNFIKSLSQEGW